MTPEEAKAILEADNKKRADECLEIIEKTLKDFKCSLAVQPVITINGQPLTVTIIPQ